MGKGAKGTTVPDPASDRTLDEDLIEATIRRVAEARAAREGAVAEATEDAAPDEHDDPDGYDPWAPSADLEPDPALAPLNIMRKPSVDEDAIQAAIRRVAEA